MQLEKKIYELIAACFAVLSNTNPLVHFDTIMCGQNKVRRLYTVNSMLKPDYILTTEWLWDWEGDLKEWNLYGSVIKLQSGFLLLLLF